MLKLKKKYREEIIPALITELGYKNPMEVPRLEKIVLNMGVGEASGNQRLIDEAAGNLAAITGQKAVVTRAKQAISNFKLKEKMPIGVKVTLHGDRMWEFLERLISIALPRVRDFRGIPRRGFDGRGNYTFGVKEQIIFLEVNFEKNYPDARHGRDVRDQRAKRRGWPRIAVRTRDAFPEIRKRHGQAFDDRKAKADPQVQGPRLQPLPPLRPSPRLHGQIRLVPHLLP